MYFFRYLKLIRDAFDHRASKEAVTTIPNLLQLVHTTLRLASAAKASLLPTAPLLTAALDAGVVNGLSPAENLAAQVRLRVFKWTLKEGLTRYEGCKNYRSFFVYNIYNDTKNI